MRLNRRTIIVSGLAVALAATALNAPAHALVVEGAVAHVVLADLKNQLSGVIDDAKNAGDSLIGSAAQRALELIKAWEKTHTTLLNLAFDRLDSSSKDLFRSIELTLDQIHRERELAVQDVQRLTVEWGQIAKTIPWGNHDVELWFHSPHVIVPVGRDDVVMHLLGPKLAQSKPELRTPDGRASALRIGPDFEINATIARNSLSFDKDASRFVVYKFSFEKAPAGFWRFWQKAETADRELMVWLPPKIMAHYKITPQTADYEYSEYDKDVGGRGKDSPYPIPIGIRPDLAAEGWKIDMKRLVAPRPGWYENIGGDHGTCAGVFNQQMSEESFVFNIQMGSVVHGFSHGDAWANCRVHVPLRRKLPTAKDLAPLEGELTWGDDVTKDIPPGILAIMTGKKIEVTMFNGRTHVIDAGHRTPLGLLTVDDHGASVTFRPNPPVQY